MPRPSISAPLTSVGLFRICIMRTEEEITVFRLYRPSVPAMASTSYRRCSLYNWSDFIRSRTCLVPRAPRFDSLDPPECCVGRRKNKGIRTINYLLYPSRRKFKRHSGLHFVFKSDTDRRNWIYPFHTARARLCYTATWLLICIRKMPGLLFSRISTTLA